VDLVVKPGEVVGIIGQNGSGKSTLLKLIAGVLQPSEGKRVVNGRLAALIELGAGFHPELTGKENVFLGGAVLGFSRKEILEKYDRIVDFSELRDFMDVAVKNYSSGMYARLAFSLATDVDPDVLLVDEILGVGDEAFQRKSEQRLTAFREAQKTILLVSHSIDTIRRVANRVLVLHRGAVHFDGPPDEAIDAYVRLLEPEAPLGTAPQEELPAVESLRRKSASV
jgi:ABC-type polysaccharide/polyol phosphate transport system ATPase subunit